MKYKISTSMGFWLLTLTVVCVAMTRIEGQQLQIKQFTLQEMTTESSDIVVAEIISANSHWNADHTRIFTEFELAVLEDIKGNITSGERFKIFQLGGSIDGITSFALEMPSLPAGSQSILFLTGRQAPEHGDYFIIFGLNQGKYDIITERGIKNIVRHVVETPLRLEEGGALLPLTSAIGISMDTFLAHIRSFIH